MRGRFLGFFSQRCGRLTRHEALETSGMRRGLSTSIHHSTKATGGSQAVRMYIIGTQWRGRCTLPSISASIIASLLEAFLDGLEERFGIVGVGVDRGRAPAFGGS